MSWDTSELLGLAAGLPRLRFLYSGRRVDGELVPRHQALGLLQVDAGVRGWLEVARFRYLIDGADRRIERCAKMGRLPDGSPRMVPAIGPSQLGSWHRVDRSDVPLSGGKIGYSLMCMRLEEA